MPTVRLAFSPGPRYVRTARLVGVAVARRAGVADELLDEVRLAISEACARAVARHRRHGIPELIRVEMSDDGPYLVRVIDACPTGAPRTGDESVGDESAGAAPAGAEPVAEAPAGDEEDADRMGEALLAGLVDDLRVLTGSEGTEVRMAWPVRRRLAEGRGSAG